MKNIYLYLMMFLAVAFVGCENNGGTEIDNPVDATLKLTADSNEVFVGDSITFEAVLDGEDVTSSAVFYRSTTAGNEKLEDNTFVAEHVGTYLFFAMHGTVQSNTIEIEVVELPGPGELYLKASKSEIVADGNDEVTFTVLLDGEDVTAESEVFYMTADGAQVIDGARFTTTTAGDYSFYATCGDLESNTVEVKVVALPAPGELNLKASKSEIVADGNDEVTFTVLLDGEDVTAESKVFYMTDGGNQVIDGVRFTTTTAGIYRFYATCEDIQSNIVEIKATAKPEEPEQPIELTATELTIKANGIDFTQFNVTQEGADVTASSTIYVNGGVLNGNKFVTTTPGEYVVYATKGNVKSNEITISAEAVTETGYTTVFAEGVTLTSGWYDVNKKAAGDNGDFNMCWAAASSNMIQWFQDRYMAAGNTLPATAVSGPGTKTYDNYGPYELALMEVYHSEWDNSLGGHAEEAIPWYFEGNLNGGEYASAGSQAVPLTAGGYWNSIWESTVLPTMYSEYNSNVGYAATYNNYMVWGNGTSYQGTERLKVVSDLIVEVFEHGMASLTVSISSNLSSSHHAVTIWGYEIDNATGLLTKVWITDSDDLMSEPKTQLLNEYSVSIDDGKSHVKLTGDTRYGAIYLVAIHPFAGYNSAE